MLFALGYIAGLLTAVFVLVVLTYFKRTIESKMTVIQKQIENAGPRPEGFIVEPDSDIERVRKNIIRKNNAQGKDTPLSDLM